MLAVGFTASFYTVLLLFLLLWHWLVGRVVGIAWWMAIGDLRKERCCDAKWLRPGWGWGTESGERERERGEGGLLWGKTVTIYVGCSHRQIISLSSHIIIVIKGILLLVECKLHCDDYSMESVSVSLNTIVYICFMRCILFCFALNIQDSIVSIS